MMDSLRVNTILVCFDAGDRAVAEQLLPAAARTMQVLEDLYGVEPPGDCRVYVMRSWSRMFFDAANWPWRVYLALIYPLLALRARRIWPIAGGWAFPLGRRQVVGVKPPDLLEAAAASGLGDRVFIPAASMSEKMLHVAAHELTHAATGVIRHHTWLREGLAMRVVDHVAGRPTVKAETVHALAQPDRNMQAGRRRLNVSDTDAFIYTYVRGYWITRFLDEAHAGLLKDLLAARRSTAQLERCLSAGLGIDRARLWHHLDDLAVEHFAPRL